MDNKLYIIAAGLASRMGGYPKHLCVINRQSGETNLEHTIKLAKPYYNSIVVVINKKLGVEYALQTSEIVNKFPDVSIKMIDSGKGDGHAVYEAIKDEKLEYVTCVWGDTYFDNDAAFALKNNANLIDIVCALEVEPYCYAMTSYTQTYITGMYFKNEVPVNHDQCYWHDQSVFHINTKIFIERFYGYMLWIDDMLRSTIKAKDYEYSIIKFVNWFIKNSKDFKYSICLKKLDSACSISFNTKEELENIIY